MFPQKFSSPPSPSTFEVDCTYQGWDVNVDRLFFANGLRMDTPVSSAWFVLTTYIIGDPWRGETVSADGLNKINTTTQPIYEGDGFHCSDLLTASGALDETIYVVQMAALEYMKAWLA